MQMAATNWLEGTDVIDWKQKLIKKVTPIENKGGGGLLSL